MYLKLNKSQYIWFFINIASNVNLNQNEHVFFYQQQINNRVYQVSCEIVNPYLITNVLNKSIYGIETECNVGQEPFSLIFSQGENLKFYLTQYLSFYLLN